MWQKHSVKLFSFHSWTCTVKSQVKPSQSWERKAKKKEKTFILIKHPLSSSSSSCMFLRRETSTMPAKHQLQLKSWAINCLWQGYLHNRNGKWNGRVSERASLCVPSESWLRGKIASIEWSEGRDEANLDLIMLIEVENLIESNPINRKWQGLWLFSLHSHLSSTLPTLHQVPSFASSSTR